MDVPPIVIPPATGPLAEVVFPESDGVADTAAFVLCPWCGERFGVALDPGSGAEQEYVEDCETCCRPILLSVRYGPDGRAAVGAAREGE